MPRSGRLRLFIKELAESPKIEKLSFIPPFLVLLVEIILLQHALVIYEPYVIGLTTLLLILSVTEIILVTQEIHEHYQIKNFERLLTIKLDDFVLERKKKNVKILVEDFISTYPQYKTYRNEIYHTACQIMETHKEEELERDLADKLNKYLKKKKEMSVDEILEGFIKKYPTYARYRIEIYEKICRLKENVEKL